VRKLRWLHRLHHDPRRMALCNFNITYPLGDWLFGSLRRE
jgi:sterol desaturase/sphingolipid hydroxylase (fatty acid hydroxylase superfamily)